MGIFVILIFVLIIATNGNTNKTANDSSTGDGSAVVIPRSIVVVTPSTTTTATSTTTDTPTSTAAPVIVAPKVYKGTGDDVVTIQKPSGSDPAIVLFECPRCQNNTIVQTNGEDSLLVNTIGKYSGSHLIDTTVGSATSQVTVKTTGSWTLTVSGLDKATQVTGQAVHGKGDSVLYVSGATSTAALTNAGSANFIVNVYPAQGGYADLAVNTIGSYKGVVPLAAPSYVQVTSDGSWTLTPS